MFTLRPLKSIRPAARESALYFRCVGNVRERLDARFPGRRMYCCGSYEWPHQTRRLFPPGSADTARHCWISENAEPLPGPSSQVVTPFPQQYSISRCGSRSICPTGSGSVAGGGCPPPRSYISLLTSMLFTTDNSSYLLIILTYYTLILT